MLLMVNLFLLFLVLDREDKSVRYMENARTQTIEVLEKNGVYLDVGLLPKEMTLPTLKMTRDMDSETTAATALLGETTQNGNQGTVSYDGVTGVGEARFYANGVFSVRLFAGMYPIGNAEPLEFALDTLAQMGFLGTERQRETPGKYALLETLSVWQTWEGTPVFSCYAELTFQEGELRAIDGQRLIGTPVATNGAKPLSVVTILLRFLAYLKETGDICKEITGITAGYTISSAQSDPVRLLPAWRITTDTASYLLDAESGFVTKERAFA